ncbi:MAG: extensin family protein [Hyphomonadaceae bacterium]
MRITGKFLRRAGLAGALALSAAAVAVSFWRGEPPAAPLQAAQITAFQSDAAACRLALADAGLEVEALPDLRGAHGCGYRSAIEMNRGFHTYSRPVDATCAAAAALAIWERDVVTPAAREHLGQAVARIEFAAPAYACRAIAGRRDGRMSEHASANAFDIGAFVLADGSRIAVAGAWRRGPARERAFLRAVRDGACGPFHAVLSPDYNRAHRDHLHFDLGPDRLCR